MSVTAHLSDMHLDKSSQRLQRFISVLNQVADLPQVDALLISGDLADHGTAAEYTEFFAHLPKGLPALALPGNHDLSAPLLAALQEHGHPANLNAVMDVGELRIIGLDSHIDGEDEGELGPEALDYAWEHLARCIDHRG